MYRVVSFLLSAMVGAFVVWRVFAQDRRAERLERDARAADHVLLRHERSYTAELRLRLSRIEKDLRLIDGLLCSAQADSSTVMAALAQSQLRRVLATLHERVS